MKEGEERSGVWWGEEEWWWRNCGERRWWRENLRVERCFIHLLRTLFDVAKRRSDRDGHNFELRTGGFPPGLEWEGCGRDSGHREAYSQFSHATSSWCSSYLHISSRAIRPGIGRLHAAGHHRDKIWSGLSEPMHRLINRVTNTS